MTDTLSTVIDTDSGPSAAGGGAVSIADPAEQQPVVDARSDLEAVFKADADARKAEEGNAPEAAKDAPAKDEKPAPEAKEKVEAQPKADAKPVADSAIEKPAAEAKPEGDEKPDAAYKEPPKNFLPDAKELYRNVPRAVRRDIDIMVRTFDEERTQLRTQAERYEPIRQFDELARQNGGDLRQSLERVHQLENLMERNPIAALNEILQQAGPRKADGQTISLFELAQHIVSQGQQGYHQMVRQQPQHAPQQQADPRVEQLQQQLVQMQQQQLVSSVIEPFKASHPRYSELENDIAFFLQSGKIPANLNHLERLEAAYDMAARINPASHDDTKMEPDPGRAGEDFSGTKSIKSSPGSVAEADSINGKTDESVSDSIRAELRRLARK